MYIVIITVSAATYTTREYTFFVDLFALADNAVANNYLIALALHPVSNVIKLRPPHRRLKKVVANRFFLRLQSTPRCK